MAACTGPRKPRRVVAGSLAGRVGDEGAGEGGRPVFRQPRAGAGCRARPGFPRRRSAVAAAAPAAACVRSGCAHRRPRAGRGRCRVVAARLLHRRWRPRRARRATRPGLRPCLILQHDRRGGGLAEHGDADHRRRPGARCARHGSGTSVNRNSATSSSDLRQPAISVVSHGPSTRSRPGLGPRFRRSPRSPVHRAPPARVRRWWLARAHRVAMPGCRRSTHRRDARIAA